MLSPARFNAMLNRMGQRIAWRRAHDCPCRDPHSGAADMHCPICNAKGVFWETAKEGRAAIAGQKVQHNWAKLGEYESGDQVLSLPADSVLYGLGQFDRLAMLQSSTPFSVVLTHDGSERLRFSVHEVIRVFWLDVDKNIVDGRIPAVGADGSPSWTAGVPPDGQQYTVTGRQHPEYFVFTELPQDRAHYGGQPLPRRVVARRMDLFSR